MAGLKVISADSHVQESPELFETRVPEEFRERLPRIVEEEDGAQYQFLEGRKKRRFDIAEGNVNEEDLEREFRSDPSGGTDIPFRLKDQDRDGIAAEVVYPNSLLHLFASPDPEYQIGVARAYNDWAIDVFGGHPDRFAPAAILPVINVEAAVQEVKRVAGLGYKLISAPIHLEHQPYSLPIYEPLWNALDETGLPLNLHFNTGSKDHSPDGIGEEQHGGFLSFMVTAMAEGIVPATVFVSSGVLARHPSMHTVIVECGAGWLPWVLYTMDDQYERKHMWIEPKLDMMPSEYFKRQGHTTFSDDLAALRMLDFIGPEALMWGSDYPHDEGTFPHSQEVIERTFAELSEENKRKIVYGNAASLYGFGGNGG